jgi:hypothetical protein
MNLKKIIVSFSLPLFLSSVLFSQSLVDLAKQEKERRKNLKGQKITVITDANLKNLKRKAAVTFVATAFPAGGTPTGESPLPLETNPAQMAQYPPDVVPPQEQKDIITQISELEQKWNSQKEYVSLLTTKINSLWQDYYSMDDMMDRGGIQKEIAETSQKLEQAQQDEAKTREELEKLRGQVKK